MRRGVLLPLLMLLGTSLGVPVPRAEEPYHAIEGWGVLPQGMSWGEVPGLAIDATGRIFVFQRSQPPVVEFDPAGAVKNTWGTGMFFWPHGIRVDRYGFLWITDGRAGNGKGQQAFECTREGQLVMTLGTAGVPAAAGRAWGPCAAASARCSAR